MQRFDSENKTRPIVSTLQTHPIDLFFAIFPITDSPFVPLGVRSLARQHARGEEKEEGKEEEEEEETRPR